VWRFSAKRRNQQGIGPMREQRIADRLTVRARAREAVPGKQIGQGRQRGAILDPGD